MGGTGSLRGTPSQKGDTLKELPQGLHIHTVACFLLHGADLVQETLELLLAALHSLWALRGPRCGTAHELLVWGARVLLWWGEVTVENVYLRGLRALAVAAGCLTLARPGSHDAKQMLTPFLSLEAFCQMQAVLAGCCGSLGWRRVGCVWLTWLVVMSCS